MESALRLASAASLKKLFERKRTVHAHLMGVNGAGMRSLARFLTACEWELSGCDLVSLPRGAGSGEGTSVYVHAGHSADHLTDATDVVIHSLAILEDHPELQAARSLEIPVFRYVDIVAGLLELFPGYGIAGTHGKTTTSCLLAHLLEQSGQRPALLCGGQILSDSSVAPADSLTGLVAECCEFRQAFREMRPHKAALLAVELDHFDCYPDVASLVEAFRGFCGNIPSDGLLVVNADSPLAVQAAAGAQCEVTYFSVSELPRLPPLSETWWQAVNVRQSSEGTSFTLASSGTVVADLQTPFFGRHQIANTVAALILAQSAGISLSTLAAGVQSFPGIQRRFQSRGFYRDWILMDDYAHHPTEIRATVAAVRQKYPGCRLVVAFQPHQILRTERLLDDFARELSLADQVYVLPIFAAREVADFRREAVSRDLVATGNRRQAIFEFCPSLDHWPTMLDDTRHNDSQAARNVFLTLGAGDIDRIYHEVPR